MLEIAIVSLIVGLAALHVGRRYLPRGWLRRHGNAALAPSSDGCATGCGSCGGCGTKSGPVTRG